MKRRCARLGLGAIFGAAVELSGRRSRRAAAFACALLPLAACRGPDPAARPGDPFSEGPSFDLASPARALAALEPLGVAPAAGDAGPRPLLALAREYQDDVQIVAAGGDGALYEQDPAPVGQGPRDIASLDVDGDGILDIVSANTGGASLTVLLRTAEGSFVTAGEVASALAPVRVAVTDIDADGHADLAAVVGLGEAAGLTLWRAEAGSLSPFGDFLPIPGASRLAAGDMDGDGDADLAVVAPEGLALLRNDTGTLVVAGTLPNPCQSLTACTIADTDGDGRGDILVACQGEAMIVHAPLAGGSRRSLPVDGRLDDLLAMDLNGDGTVDVAGVDVAMHTAVLWLSPEDDPITTAPPFVHPVPRGPLAIVAVDLERDGDIDLAVLGYEDKRVGILQNQAPE